MTRLQDVYAARVSEGTITADPVQQAMLPHMDRVLYELSLPVRKSLFRKAPDPVRGLYLWGGVGRGKSMLMDLMFDCVEVSKERWHFHAFMQAIHRGMTEARKRGVDDAIAPVADDIASRIRFLAFDEVQITDVTDAMIVGRVFERLFAAGVTIVATSNRVPGDLYKNGINREVFLPFIALMEERLEVVEMAGDVDHREGRLAGAPRYFTPINAETRAQMARIWEDIAHGQGHPEVLRVLGRDVELSQFWNGVARCSFHDLCGRPLGPADYLALAEAVRVLLIDDIPQLSSENFNEAKRFVTLIDALYEAKVTLICSAAARPDMLYVEGEGSFEFGRTASRLNEMQSAGWGA